MIKELLATEPSAVEGKKKIDHVIDVCGPAPKGNGLQNLRECIIETKWKYDVAPEEKQVKIQLTCVFCGEGEGRVLPCLFIVGCLEANDP